VLVEGLTLEQMRGMLRLRQEQISRDLAKRTKTLMARRPSFCAAALQTAHEARSCLACRDDGVHDPPRFVRHHWRRT
jgi:hypothetical protein